MLGQARGWTKLWLEPSLFKGQEPPPPIYLPLPLPVIQYHLFGRPVLWGLDDSGKTTCLCAQDKKNGLQWSIDWKAWLNQIQQLTDREPPMPFYLKIPKFNIECVPQSIRTVIFHTLFKSGVSRRRPPDIYQSSGLLRLSRWMESLRSPKAIKRPTFLCFSIDVDTGHTFKTQAQPLRQMLEERGYRAAWYFLTGKYRLDDMLLSSLRESGHEIGWHGHVHDHRLGFLKSQERREILKNVNSFFARYNVKGMRAPHFLWSRALHQDVSGMLCYDTSFHDTYPFSEDGVGCGTSLPFFTSSGLWELPITITSDHFYPQSWSLEQKLDVMKLQLETQIALGGVAHLVLHPEPSITLKPSNLQLFSRFLDYVDRYRNRLTHKLPIEIVNHFRGEFQEKSGSLTDPKAVHAALEDIDRGWPKTG